MNRWAIIERPSGTGPAKTCRTDHLATDRISNDIALFIYLDAAMPTKYVPGSAICSIAFDPPYMDKPEITIAACVICGAVCPGLIGSHGSFGNFDGLWLIYHYCL
jgi:hypothetical protein